MAIDDWKQKQDAARQEWAENSAQKCSDVEKKWQCDQIEKKWQCDQIEKKWHCDVEEEKKSCDDWSPLFSWICMGWSYVKTGICLAGQWIETGLCLAGQWIETGLCLAGQWIETGLCLAGIWVVDKLWAAGTVIAWAAGKIYEDVIVPLLNWVNGFFTNVIDWFREEKPDHPEDIVPDFAGINFDRRDDAGNVIPFLWGVSTASHQVEGDIKTSDWHRFTTSATIKRRVERVASLGETELRIEPPGTAVDHWNLDVLKDDLDRAKLLGMNTYRFSLEWSRIQPQKPSWVDNYIKGQEAGDALENPPYDPNEFEIYPIEHYKQMIKLMQDRGLQVILTLNHMSLPDWVLTPPIAHEITHLSAVEDDRFRNSLRGWENPVTVKAYENFVRFVVPHFKDSVSYWITLNEPIGSVMAAGYLGGVWPPGFLGDGERAKKVYFNFIDAHVRAYNVIKELASKNAQVGVSHIVMYARRAPQTVAEKLLIGDNEAAKNQWVYAFNHYFLDAVIKGGFNQDIWRKDIPKHKEEWTGKLDFIAPQYYRATDIYHDDTIALKAPWFGGGSHVDLRKRTDYLSKYLWNDLGWTIYPSGLYQILKDFHDRYGKPILITENGMAESEDRNRAAYTIAHLQQVLRAIKDGINVIGYVHWTIVDNWEWAFDYLNEARFGLFTVDRSIDLAASGSSSNPRHITEGAVALQYVIENSQRITATNSGEDPFIEPVARFGTINPDGLVVQPPIKIPGALWEGFIEDGASSRAFMLYMSRLPGNSWLGMMFFQDKQCWVRLQDIHWHPVLDPESQLSIDGILTFHHPTSRNAMNFDEYTAKTTNLDSGQAIIGIHGGMLSENGIEKIWSAKRVLRTGVWKSSSVYPFPSFIAINRLEGNNDRWHSKYLYLMTDSLQGTTSKPHWAPGATSITWNESKINIEVIEITDIKIIEGTLNGDLLRAAVTLKDGNTTTWEGKRLPDDISF